MKYIRNVHWQYDSPDDGGILTGGPDYLLGSTTAAVFISLRYHLLNPEYVYGRMKGVKAWLREARGDAGARVRGKLIVVQVDTEDSQVPLAQITKAAIHNEFTVFCGFSAGECARYLETFKSYENKPAEAIKKDLGGDYAGRATSVLTGVRGVNTTDVKTLLSDGRCLADVMGMDDKGLEGLPGVGPTKARRLYDAFSKGF